MSRAFKRWLERWYPHDAGWYDTYEEHRREWTPYRRVALQMASLMIGLLMIAIPAMIYYATIPYDSWFRPVFGIAAILCMAVWAVTGMIIADTIYDRRSAKPTPPKTSRS